MIDAPSPVVFEGVSEVIPIRVLNAIGVQFAKQIDKSPACCFLVCVARIDMKVDIIDAMLRMINVNGFGCDVQVAEPDRRLPRVKIRLEIVPNSLEPCQFERILFGLDLEPCGT